MGGIAAAAAKAVPGRLREPFAEWLLQWSNVEDEDETVEAEDEEGVVAVVAVVGGGRRPWR
jgi:hypothetical protein